MFQQILNISKTRHPFNLLFEPLQNAPFEAYIISIECRILFISIYDPSCCRREGKWGLDNNNDSRLWGLLLDINQHYNNKPPTSRHIIYLSKVTNPVPVLYSTWRRAIPSSLSIIDWFLFQNVPSIREAEVPRHGSV